MMREEERVRLRDVSRAPRAAARTRYIRKSPHGFCLRYRPFSVGFSILSKFFFRGSKRFMHLIIFFFFFFFLACGFLLIHCRIFRII